MFLKTQLRWLGLGYSRNLELGGFMSKDMQAEVSAATPPTVVPGLGYPNDRRETSPEPTGWQANPEEKLVIEKKVSRETNR